jgi:amidase
MNLHDLTALEAAAAVRRGEVSPVELVEHALDRIGSLDGRLGAFVTVSADAALQHAKAAEDAVLAADRPDDLPPLLGVPTAIKDLNLTKGVMTKLGSTLYRDFVPDIDDYVVEALRNAGAISVGKTATPEFGLACYTETDIGPPARNPWDLSRTPGGSSGGAAAAVAAGLIAFAQGSDGGGSIRIPASACGLVGLKPARGRVSKGPLDIDSSRLSVYGGLARTVRDAAAFLDAVAGPRPGDPDPLPLPPQPFLRACERDPGRLRIGRFIQPPMDADIDAQVRDAWEKASLLLSSLGHDVADVHSPVPAAAVPAFETVWAVSAHTAPVDPAREAELRPLTRYLRERGRAVTGPQYAQAVGTLGLLARQAMAASAAFDAVLTPTLATLPPSIGWFTDADPAVDFERQKRFTPFTAAVNTTGQPAISLPLYQSAEGLPIGMMFVGRRADEATLLSLAAQLESAAPWRDRHAPPWAA